MWKKGSSYERGNKNNIMTLCIVFLVFVSIGLTILEMQSPYLTLETKQWLSSIQISILIIFLLELVYRVSTAPEIYPHLSPAQSRWKLFASPLTIIDIIVVSPLLFPLFGYSEVFSSHSDFVVLRLFRITSILNFTKLYRNSAVVRILTEVMREIKSELLIVGVLVFQVIIIASVFVFHFEHGQNPEIQTFFDAVYYTVVVITTVGFGDITPVTLGGRLVSMATSLLGIGLVALPVGILSAGFFRSVREKDEMSMKKQTRE